MLYARWAYDTKIKIMLYGQTWSCCLPQNAVLTAFSFITRNLVPWWCESHYISDAHTYQSGIYSPLQYHVTFTLLHNLIIILVPFLWRLTYSMQEYGIPPHSRPYYCILFSLYHMFISCYFLLTMYGHQGKAGTLSHVISVNYRKL